MYDFFNNCLVAWFLPVWGERVLRGKDLGDIETFQQKFHIAIKEIDILDTITA